MVYTDRKASVTAPPTNWHPNLRVEGWLHVEVRCPFCDEIHSHGVTSREALLGALVHRHAKCWSLDDEHPRRGRRRRQLDAGKARHDEAGGGYFIPLVGIRPGELRK